MSETRVASRYARAILELADETGKIDAVARDFDMLSRLIDGSRDLALFLRSPVIVTEKKKSIVAEMFKGRVTDLTLKFLLLLVGKNREMLLRNITTAMLTLLDARKGVMNVDVSTAAPLTKEQEARLTEEIRRISGKQPRMSTRVDPSLIGGFMVRFEDTVWDGTVRRQLDRLMERVAGTSM